MTKRFWLLLPLMLCAGLPAAAGESYGPTDEEKKLLPPYCGGPGGGDWKTILGPQHIYNNHTCYGINRINRYYKQYGTKNKDRHLEVALNDFDYSLGHLKPDFKLMPEIHYYRGLTYKLLKRHSEAASDFAKSINLNPKYSRSVAELADLFAGPLASPDKALPLVTEGLRHNPNSKELKRRYDQYGGKPPYPEPHGKTEAPASVAKGEESVKGQADAPREAPVPPKPEAPAVPSIPTAPQAAPVPATPPAGKPPQAAGASPNSWCRFCPDPALAKDPGPSRPTAPPTTAR